MQNRPLIGFIVVTILIVGISVCIDQTPNNTNYTTGTNHSTSQNGTNTSTHHVQHVMELAQ